MTSSVASKRKSILEDVGTYATSAYVAQMLDFINGILVRRLLGPASMGLWAFLQVIVNYSKYSLLGTAQAANREIPYLNGKGEYKKAEELQNTVYGFAVLSGIVNAVVCIGYGLWQKDKHSPEFFMGLVACALIIYGQRIYNYALVILRVTKKFQVVAKLMIFSSAMTVLLTVALTLPFGFYGFLVSQVAIYGINTWFINHYSPIGFRFCWNWEKLKPVLKLGLSLILCQVAYTVLTSLDRIMIAKMLGFKALGVFSIALMANTYIMSFPNMAGIVLFPYYQEKFGQGDSIQDLKNYVIYPIVSLTYLLPFLIGTVSFVSPLLIHYFLPAYSNGLAALQVLLVASYFLCMSQPLSIFLVTINRQFHLFIVTVISVCLAAVGIWIGIKMEGGIVGVAVAELIAFAFFLFILQSICLKHYLDKAGVLRMALKVLLVASYSFVGLYWIARAMDTFHGLNLITSALVRLLVCYVYLSPLLYFAERETQVVSHGVDVMKGRFRSLFLTRGKGQNDT